MATVCSLPLPVRAVLVEDAAVARVAVVVVRDAVVAAVNSAAARAVAVVAKAVANSVVDAVAAMVLVDAAKAVDVEDVVETSPAPTSPTPALSPAWAHRFDKQSTPTRLKGAVSTHPSVMCRWI
jgi:hypothetical protein